MQYRTYYSSPAGQILILADEDAVISLTFLDSTEVEASATHPVLQQCKCWLDAYFAGKHPDLTEIPVRLSGTPFQQRVWQILLQIPYGQSVTYGQIAKQISPNMSAQAVGGAVGSNPVSIIIPCHRVLGKNRKLTGYAFGLDRKQVLLDLEGIPYHK